MNAHRDRFYDEQRQIAGCHEAGHAMAAYLSGVKILKIHVGKKGDACVETERDAADNLAYAFIGYAGPWAEAYLGWQQTTFDGSTLDSDGRSYTDRVVFEMRHSARDWELYEQDLGGTTTLADILEALACEVAKDAGVAGPAEVEWPPMSPFDPTWHGKLQPWWPEIQVLAAQIDRRESLTVGDITIYEWES